MITKFRAENYGCLKHVEVELTQVHAFIGPNDSGKSTLLAAIRSLVQFASGIFTQNQAGEWLPFNPWMKTKAGEAGRLLRAGTTSGWYSVETTANTTEEKAHCGDPREPFSMAERTSWSHPSPFHREPGLQPLLTELSSARLVRFDADALRRPTGLVPSTQLDSLDFGSDRGVGLPSVLYGIREKDYDSFSALIDSLRRSFPTLKALRLPAATESTLTLEAELVDGTRAGPDRMSEGVLRFLALSTLRFLAPCSVVLVEAPENGLHPARVGEAIRAMRELAAETHTQVLIATHSPLVIDELQPDEVTVLTRPSVEEGTKTTPHQEYAQL